MLALTLQFIIAIVAYAINERMARRIEYLLQEVRVLREVYTQTTGRNRDPVSTTAWTALLKSGGVKSVRIPRLVTPRPCLGNDNATSGAVRCRSRLGGLLNFYQRVAA
jgi:hypothetical protein